MIEWDDDADNAALIAAQNRDIDPDGDTDAPDPGAYEEPTSSDPVAPIAPDSVDDFSDLDDGDDSNDDLGDDSDD